MKINEKNESLDELSKKYSTRIVKQIVQQIANQIKPYVRTYVPSIANGFIMCFAKSSDASMKNERTDSSGARPLCNNNITVPPGVIKAETKRELNRSTTRRNLHVRTYVFVKEYKNNEINKN